MSKLTSPVLSQTEQFSFDHGWTRINTDFKTVYLFGLIAAHHSMGVLIFKNVFPIRVCRIIVVKTVFHCPIPDRGTV